MEVDDTNAEYLLNVSEEDFCQYLIRKHTIHPPVLKVEDIYAYEPVEVDIDVSRDPRRAIYDRSRPFYVKGTRVTIEVPFDGEEDLFDFRPSSFDSCPPRGVVRDSALRLVYDVLEQATFQAVDNQTGVSFSLLSGRGYRCSIVRLLAWETRLGGQGKE